MHFHCNVSISLIFFHVLLTLITLFGIISRVLRNISGFTPVHDLESYLQRAAIHLVFWLFPDHKRKI